MGGTWIQVAVALAGLVDGAPEPTELEQAVVDHRNAIDRFEFDMTYTLVRKAGPPLRADYHVYVSGPKQRIDRTVHVPAGPTSNAGEHSVVSKDGARIEKKIVADGRYIFWSPDEHPDGTRCAVEMGTIDDKSGHLDDFFNPRAIGIRPVAFILQPKYTSVGLHFGPEAVEVVLIERDVIDGHDVWRCEWRRDDRLSYRYWISPDEGFSVVRSETESKFAERTMIDRVESAVAPALPSTEWFPTRVAFTRTLDGREVHTESLEITNARFDAPDSDIVFTLEGLGVRPGTSIYERTVERHITGRKWDGKEILPVTAADLKLHQAAEPSPPSRRRFYLILIAANASAVALALLVIYFRRRRAAR